jgi:NADH-quinone oxidoreductase subunit H
METVLNHPLFIPIAIILVVMALFPLVAGYIVLVERKVLADIQVRLGPMRVGPHGLLQPIADALKLLIKEDTIPAESDPPPSSPPSPPLLPSASSRSPKPSASPTSTSAS